MGQYFLICNLDKKEVIDPGEFGHGMKLGDMVSNSQGALMGLTYLLALSGSIGGVERRARDPMFGRWAGDRIAIVGDYFSETVAGMTWDEDVWLRVSAWRDGWVDISEHVIRSMEEFFEVQVPRVRDNEPQRSIVQPDGRVIPNGVPSWWVDDEDGPSPSGSDSDQRGGTGS